MSKIFSRKQCATLRNFLTIERFHKNKTPDFVEMAQNPLYISVAIPTMIGGPESLGYLDTVIHNYRPSHYLTSTFCLLVKFK